MNPEPECKCEFMVHRRTHAGTPYTEPCGKPAALCKCVGLVSQLSIPMRLCEFHRQHIKRVQHWEVTVL